MDIKRVTKLIDKEQQVLQEMIENLKIIKEICEDFIKKMNEIDEKKKEVIKMYKCKVCGEEYKETKQHLVGELACFDEIDIKDEKHRQEYRKIMKSIRLTSGKYAEEKCFCGGKIKLTWWGDGDAYSMNAICEDCGFLWDED